MAKNASLSEVKDITKKLVTEDAKRASFTEPPAIGNSANIKDGTEIRTRQYAESFDPNGDNPFADPEVAERYAMIYEKAQYECRHFFDPTFIWTPQEEKILVRKLDWHVCLWAVRGPTSTLFKSRETHFFVFLLVRHVFCPPG